MLYKRNLKSISWFDSSGGRTGGSGKILGCERRWWMLDNGCFAAFIRSSHTHRETFPPRKWTWKPETWKWTWKPERKFDGGDKTDIGGKNLQIVETLFKLLWRLYTYPWWVMHLLSATLKFDSGDFQTLEERDLDCDHVYYHDHDQHKPRQSLLPWPWSKR